jgi:hypothetical protein
MTKIKQKSILKKIAWVNPGKPIKHVNWVMIIKSPHRKQFEKKNHET